MFKCVFTYGSGSVISFTKYIYIYIFCIRYLTNFILFICWRRNKYNLFCKTVLIWLFCHVSFKRKRNVTLAFYFGFVVLTLILYNNATIFIFKCGSLRWSSLTDVHPCFWQKTRQTLFTLPFLSSCSLPLSALYLLQPLTLSRESLLLW